MELKVSLFTLSALGIAILLIASMIAVTFRESLDAGTVGLSLTYAAGITKELKKLTKETSKLASNIVSIERLKEYSNVSPEEPIEMSKNVPRDDWPTSGDIEISRHSTKYRPELDYALNDVNISIKVN